MKTTNQISIRRRVFIKMMLRILTAGGILVSGAMLATRRRDDTSDTQDCPLDITCRGCSKFTGCNQSRAQQAKSALAKKGGRLAGS